MTPEQANEIIELLKEINQTVRSISDKVNHMQ